MAHNQFEDSWLSETGGADELAENAVMVLISELEQGKIDTMVGRRWQVMRLPFGQRVWKVQWRTPSTWLRTGHSTVYVVRVVGMFLEEVSRRRFDAGFTLENCVVHGIIRQVSGTCYLNTSVHLLCLGQKCSPVVLKAIQAQVDAMESAQARKFFEVSLDVYQGCTFSWFDTLRLFYAIICPESPTRTNINAMGMGQLSDVNIAAGIIHGFNNSQKSNGGGNTAYSMIYLLTKLKIAHAVLSLENDTLEEVTSCKDPDIVLFVRDHMPSNMRRLMTLSYRDADYHMDTAGIGMHSGDTHGHVVACVFCAGQPGVVDSNIGEFRAFDWLSTTDSLFIKFVNAMYRHLSVQTSFAVCDQTYTVYVKKSAEGSPTARIYGLFNPLI